MRAPDPGMTQSPGGLQERGSAAHRGTLKAKTGGIVRRNASPMHRLPVANGISGVRFPRLRVMLPLLPFPPPAVRRTVPASGQVAERHAPSQPVFAADSTRGEKNNSSTCSPSRAFQRRDRTMRRCRRNSSLGTLPAAEGAINLSQRRRGS